jgi:hypothetical protein
MLTTYIIICAALLIVEAVLFNRFHRAASKPTGLRVALGVCTALLLVAAVVLIVTAVSG